MKWTFSLALYLVLMAAVNGLLFLSHYREYKEALHTDSKRLLDAVHERLFFDLFEVYSDLRFLADHPVNLSDTAAFETEYLSLITHKKRYDQIRLLDREGMERIRVNADDGKPYVVDRSQLQNKRHRYYFSDIIGLRFGEVYISPLDLNIEYHQVEVPLKPMIRFASPVADRSGRPAGIVVLNYLAEGMLTQLRRLAQDFQGEILLLNEEGYYLVGFNREEEWGFMFPGKTDRTFERFDSSVWQAMQQERNGHLETEYGVFDFETLDLKQSVGESDVPLMCRECGWKVVTIVPSKVVMQQVMEQFMKFLPLNILLLLVGSAGLYLLFAGIRRRRHQENEIDQLNRAIASERELFIAGPTVIMEFRNAYGWPVTFVSENVRSIFGYEKRQFDTAELDLASIIAPEYLERFAETMASALRETRLHFEHDPFEIVAAEGRRVWVQGVMSLIRDPEGKISHFLGYFNDISALKAAEHEIHKAGAFVQTVVDSIADPTLVIDIDSYAVVLANKAARDFYAAGEGPMAAMTCYQMSHARSEPCNSADDPCPIAEILQTRKAARVIHKHYAKDGREVYVELVAMPIFDEAGNVVQIIESHRDISHHIELEAELKQLASTDKLTQAFNRARFDEVLHEQMESALRYEISLGVIMFDIDYFKKVNDTYGHDAGDKVLIEIVGLVKKRIRHQDLLARWGGEEFVILIPKSHESALQTMAESLRHAVEEHTFKTVGRITASFGATLICSGDTAESLMKRVDEALYRSKAQGRNRTTLVMCGEGRPDTPS